MEKYFHMLADELRKLCAAALAVLAGLTLVGFVGISTYVDVLSNFRPLYVPAALILLLVFIRHDRRLALGALAVVIVNAATLLPWAPLNRTICDPDTRVLAVNAFGEWSDQDVLLAQIEAQDPDIVFISELIPSLEARVAERFPHVVWSPEFFGVGLFSKYPVQQSEHFQSGERPHINAVLTTPRGPLRVLGAHPFPPYGGEHSENRNKTLNRLAELARDSTEPVMVIGDLNVTMFSPRYRPLEQAGLRNARAGRGLQGTWPRIFPLRLALDHVLVSEELAVCQVEVGPSFRSDHLPLRASFRWKDSHSLASPRSSR